MELQQLWMNKAYAQRSLYWTLFRLDIADTPPWTRPPRKPKSPGPRK